MSAVKTLWRATADRESLLPFHPKCTLKNLPPRRERKALTASLAEVDGSDAKASVNEHQPT